jgi:hypothetical protein
MNQYKIFIFDMDGVIVIKFIIKFKNFDKIEKKIFFFNFLNFFWNLKFEFYF